MKIEILPSLLAADFGRLGDEIRRAEASGAEALHLDIMDAHFVPNLSFGPDVVALAKRTSPGFCRNVHLMMSRPDLYLAKFADAGAQTIQIHVEADCDLHTELRRIREMGLKNAIVLNPETPVERLEPYLREIDEALVMTVHPGYGGQSFIAECLPKVTWLRERCPALDIMVDGGVNAETAVLAARAGANQFVAGSYLFKQSDMKLAVEEMKASISSAVGMSH
jgi:ribulose-phosphate 3-epimerase